MYNNGNATIGDAVFKGGAIIFYKRHGKAKKEYCFPSLQSKGKAKAESPHRSAQLPLLTTCSCFSNLSACTAATIPLLRVPGALR